MHIDVHAHYVPPQVLATLEKDAAYQVKVDTVAQGGQCLRFGYGPVLRPFLPRLLDLDQRWEVMQQQGVDRQLLSVWPGIFGYGMSPKAGRRWHRLLNETLCETAQRQPERFGALASVPLQDPYLAAEELSHAVELCGAIGGIIGANIEGRNLDDPPLDPFWAAAEALDVPLFLHPIQPLPTPRTGRYYLNAIAHYVYDTTVAIGCLIFSGVLDRFPGLQIILAHGGGFFPYQVGRFDQAYRNIQETSAVAVQRPSACLGASSTTLSCMTPQRYGYWLIWLASSVFHWAATIPSQWVTLLLYKFWRAQGSRPTTKPRWRAATPNYCSSSEQH